MIWEFNNAVSDLIAEQTGIATKIADVKSVLGGSINRAFQIACYDGRQFFVKSNSSALRAMFAAEIRGLESLAATRTIRVPAVVGTGVTETAESFLILEWIPTGNQAFNFSELLGRQLAELHRNGRQDSCGMDHDNFIGSTPQQNTPGHDWADFWWEHRMEFQLKLARQNGFGDSLKPVKLARFEKRVREQLGNRNEPPTLIHGDLWRGNYLAGSAGEPVLIDPAVYCGDRVAEFGMTSLFGGFDARFYAAYDEAWPLPAGWESRVEIYKLYHLLNHLNLFGNSYLEPCLEILRKYR